MKTFPLYKQPPGTKTCGASCLQMISDHYGKKYHLNYLVRLSATTHEGTSFFSVGQAAETLGFRTLGIKIGVHQLTASTSLPCIAHVNSDHFVVIYKIKGNTIYLADPLDGFRTLTKREFAGTWADTKDNTGTLLFLEPTADFYKMISIEEMPEMGAVKSLPGFLYKQLRNYKFLSFQVILGLMLGSFFQLLVPFITQNIIDAGIQGRDIGIIYLLLAGQLFIFFGRTTVDVIRNWVVVYLSSRINLSMVTDLYIKLMRVPASYFDKKKAGQVLQRIYDSQRVEQFLTGSSFRTLFSLMNFVVFGLVLFLYNAAIFGVFVAGSIFYFLWVNFFLKKRAVLDQQLSDLQTRNNNMIIETVNGIPEIKLHGAEQNVRWQWQQIQLQLQQVRLKALSLNQFQSSGAATINELKNILITFLTAKLVLDGEISLGMLLSITYITGQLNVPLMEMISFLQQYSDAKLSLKRISEVQNEKNEEESGKKYKHAPEKGTGIRIRNLTFGYEASQVLRNLDLDIPANKVTAIVGASGSGKSTLIKLLLKFYKPDKGTVLLGETDLGDISPRAWRERCGTVMQDGNLFSETIAANIAFGKNSINMERVKYSARIANIHAFIESLPESYGTRLGYNGTGLSAGQRQRMLIARAVYKDPEYLFFDEITSSLDSINEKIIMENLAEFFKGRTVVIIAHRLSTVKNADQIVMLENGRISESGSHHELTAMKGNYFDFVRNQLEISK